MQNTLSFDFVEQAIRLSQLHDLSVFLSQHIGPLVVLNA